MLRICLALAMQYLRNPEFQNSTRQFDHFGICYRGWHLGFFECSRQYIPNFSNPLDNIFLHACNQTGLKELVNSTISYLKMSSEKYYMDSTSKGRLRKFSSEGLRKKQKKKHILPSSAQL